MKKLFALFLLFFMVPTVSWGGEDGCTFPKDYTIDKRCYVTETQKKQKPYSATVALRDGDFVYCTGTIIKHDDGNLYLYTAKHCVVDYLDNVADTVIIKTQDDTSITVHKYKTGNYNTEAKWSGVFSGDWAIYSVPSEYNNIAWTNINVSYNVNGQYKLSIDAEVVGYGSLKIMSDAEIAAFKQKYVDYLEKEGRGTTAGERTALFNRESGVHTSGWMASNFLGCLKISDRDYYRRLFRNNGMLKTSSCQYTSSGKRLGCQSWEGNSGGGVFDRYGQLMGILNTGNDSIGGEKHAYATDYGNVDFMSLNTKRLIKKK